METGSKRSFFIKQEQNEFDSGASYYPTTLKSDPKTQKQTVQKMPLVIYLNKSRNFRGSQKNSNKVNTILPTYKVIKSKAETPITNMKTCTGFPKYSNLTNLIKLSRGLDKGFPGRVKSIASVSATGHNAIQRKEVDVGIDPPYLSSMYADDISNEVSISDVHKQVDETLKVPVEIQADRQRETSRVSSSLLSKNFVFQTGSTNIIINKGFDHDIYTTTEVNVEKHVQKDCDKKSVTFDIVHDETMGELIRCKICSCRFTQPRKFQQHMSAFHLDHPDIDCEICNQVFETREQLDLHMNVHNDEYPYKCANCGKRFDGEPKLKLHLTSQNKCVLPALKCKLCVKKFFSYPEFNRHLSIDHEGSLCDICCICLNDQCKEDNHFVEYLKPYKCAICYEQFSFKREYYTHHATSHKKKPNEKYKVINGSTRERKQCQFCELSFHCDAKLITHERTHTGEKPFPCQYCGRCFSQNRRLKVHERLHTGERPYQCELCGKELLEKRNIKRHSCPMRK